MKQVIPAPSDWLETYTQYPPTINTQYPPTIDTRLLQPQIEKVQTVKPPTTTVQVRAQHGTRMHRAGQAFQRMSFDGEHTIINRQWVQTCVYGSFTVWVIC